jgi:hypothetical protein
MQINSHSIVANNMDQSLWSVLLFFLLIHLFRFLAFPPRLVSSFFSMSLNLSDISLLICSSFRSIYSSFWSIIWRMLDSVLTTWIDRLHIYLEEVDITKANGFLCNWRYIVPEQKKNQIFFKIRWIWLRGQNLYIIC